MRGSLNLYQRMFSQQMAMNSKVHNGTMFSWFGFVCCLFLLSLCHEYLAICWMSLSNSPFKPQGPLWKKRQKDLFIFLYLIYNLKDQLRHTVFLYYFLCFYFINFCFYYFLSSTEFGLYSFLISIILELSYEVMYLTLSDFIFYVDTYRNKFSFQS